jgi:Oxidoreductase molybdopterin binding domain
MPNKRIFSLPPGQRETASFPRFGLTPFATRFPSQIEFLELQMDLLAPDVLLADRLFGQPLSLEHGAPLRLVALGHYGYKSVKHLDRIEFRVSDAGYRPYGLRFMVHPRARVAFEERGQWLPGWLLRVLYRPLIGPTVKHFEKATLQYTERGRSKESHDS